MTSRDSGSQSARDRDVSNPAFGPFRRARAGIRTGFGLLAMVGASLIGMNEWADTYATAPAGHPGSAASFRR